MKRTKMINYFGVYYKTVGLYAIALKIGNDIGCSPNTIRNILNGANAGIDLWILIKNYYHIAPVIIFEWIEESNHPIKELWNKKK